jgi:hypothetical protein
MVLLIVRETNRQANKSVREWNNAHQDTNNKHMWIDTHDIEVCAFIGLLIYAGSQNYQADVLKNSGQPNMADQCSAQQ